MVVLELRRAHAAAGGARQPLPPIAGGHPHVDALAALLEGPVRARLEALVEGRSRLVVLLDCDEVMAGFDWEELSEVQGHPLEGALMLRLGRVSRAEAWNISLRKRAEELGQGAGYLGVEHLIQAICESPDWEPSGWLAASRGALDALASSQPVQAGPWRGPTPRVEALGPLPDSLLRVPWVARELPPKVLSELASRGVLVRSPWEPVPEGPGMLLEVWGGPDDGARVELLHRFSHLGRDHDGNAALGPRLRGDPSVSREHLQYLGEGGLLALGRTDHNGTRVRGAFRVAPGDVLRLGKATRLEVLRV